MSSSRSFPTHARPVGDGHLPIPTASDPSSTDISGLPPKSLPKLPVSHFITTAAKEVCYDFYGERGVFKLANPQNRRDPVIIEMRRGSVLVLKPPSNLWTLRRSVVIGATGFGSLLGYLTLLLVRGSGTNLALVVLGLFSFVAVAALVVTIEERWFWPHVARSIPEGGLEIHVDRVEYHLFYHTLIASSDGQRFQLTVGGLASRVRRALTLAVS